MSTTEAVNAPAPEAVAPPVATPPVTEAAPTPADPFDTGADKFDRPYVEKLRNENAERRVALKKYEEAFGQYDAEAQEVWLGVAKLTATDAKAGAEALEEIVKYIRQGLTPEQAADKAGVTTTTEPDKPLTRAELDEYWNTKELESKTAAEGVRIQAEAIAAGYKPGTPEYEALMLLALNHTNLDLGEAIKQTKVREQAIIDKWVADKAASGEKWPITAPVGSAGVPSSDEKPIGGLEGSKKSLLARLKSNAGQ